MWFVVWDCTAINGIVVDVPGNEKRGNKESIWCFRIVANKIKTLTELLYSGYVAWRKGESVVGSRSSGMVLLLGGNSCFGRCLWNK